MTQAAGPAGVEDDEARAQLEALVVNTRRYEIENFPMGDPRGGIDDLYRGVQSIECCGGCFLA